VEILRQAREAAGWNDLDQKIQLDLMQIHDEMSNLLHRLGNNLDYFGNPVGWVPMLSFEVNTSAFENEIPHALRVMYLNYWLGNKAATIEENIDAMKELRLQLRDQIAADQAE
jgi:hypothetical protein